MRCMRMLGAIDSSLHPDKILENGHGFGQVVSGEDAIRTMLASLIAVSQFASNATRRVVGQWGGAGGAICEDHLAFCGELLVRGA